jgi:opacity protein-like surface antigen
MHRDSLFGIGLLATVAAGGGSAAAADIPVRPGPPPVAAPATCCAVPDWTGFYVGIHGGGGWGHESVDRGFFDSREAVLFPFEQFFTTPNSSPKGGVFGFQFGHNWQWGPVVGGLEIDFSGADIKETTTFVDPFFPTSRSFTRDFKIDELASARGRLGYLILPNWLIYGTAGIGWARTRLNESETDTFPAPGTTPFSPFFRQEQSFVNEFGWVAGVGLEWKFWPGSNSWLLRGEWLHYDFGRNNHFDLMGPAVIPGTVSPATFFPDSVRTTVDVARAALSYKF